MMRFVRSHHKNHGFTIIELLIATTVFSLILLIVTAGIMLFTHDFYKGVVGVSTQNVARNITTTFGQAIQFSPLTNPYPGWPAILPAGSLQAYCINGIRYSYLLGEQLNPGGTGFSAPQVLVADTNFNCSQSRQALMTPDAFEIMGKHMRLAQFNVALVPGSTDAYAINVRVVYGDDDLLCSPSEVPGSCTTQATMTSISDYQTPDLTCKGQVGSQFCAVSELDTVVVKRL